MFTGGTLVLTHDHVVSSHDVVCLISEFVHG